MGRFWDKFNELFGDRPAALWGEKVPELWVLGLSGVPGILIAHGLSRAARGEHETDPSRKGWPPNLVAFRALCEPDPEKLGTPSEDDAWSDAVQIARRWKHPHQCLHEAVWHALSQIGDFHGIAEDVLEVRFRKNYQQAVRMLATGGKLQPIPQPLPAPKDVRATPAPAEVREAALAKIYAMFGKRRASA